MTGCPYSLIYSSAQTFDRLRTSERVDYHDGLIVIRVGQTGDVPYVIARDMRTGSHHTFESDRIYLALGAVGTTRLVLSSLKVFDQDVELSESAQFLTPMISTRPTNDPRDDETFTLSQFNMVVSLDDDWLDVSQIHFYRTTPQSPMRCQRH